MPSLNMSIVILITHYYVPMVLAVFPISVTIGTETHASVNVRFHRKRIGFVLAFGSSLVLGAIYLCLGCGVGFLGTKVLGLWFSSLGI